MSRILITGGAGFIGSHLADSLYQKGHEITIIDNLDPQVHKGGNIPDYINPNFKFINADIRDRDKVADSVMEADDIFHFAASTGQGQSMYKIMDYISVNIGGTATILDILANEKHNVKKFIFASSRAVYGEGKYYCDNCGVVYPEARPEASLCKAEWETKCPNCTKECHMLPTDEESPLNPSNIYSLTKEYGEKLCIKIGKTYGISTTCLRFFNVYGERQSLSNPYTGILPIFVSRLLNGKQIEVYEDGKESRDFVYVSDAVKGIILALTSKASDYEIFNVGSGESTTLLKAAELISRELNRKPPIITGKYRVGDIRHCSAELSKIKSKLGYAPEFSFEKGVKQLIPFLKSQVSEDLSEKAKSELIKKGLFR